MNNALNINELIEKYNTNKSHYRSSGYNETQLNSLNTALSDATQSDCRSRFLDFTNNMTALQTALTAL